MVWQKGKLLGSHDDAADGYTKRIYYQTAQIKVKMARQKGQTTG